MVRKAVAHELVSYIDAFGPEASTLMLQCRDVIVSLCEQRAALLVAALPFAAHDWCDADLEDDNCKLTRHSGNITVAHWRALREAIAKAESSHAR
jgi:hypothetical protein